MKIGDRIRVVKIPNLDGLPDETKRLFAACVGRVFPIFDIRDDGQFELEVGEAVGAYSFLETIWIEPECVEPE